MEIIGTIFSLFTFGGEKQQQASLTLDTKGILGDKHYNKTIERSILVSSIDSYILVKKNLGIEMPYGYLGENILLSGNPYQLSTGTRLHIGDVILEITQQCTLCQHLGVLDKRIPKLLKHDRGIFAKVVKGGEVRQHQTAYVK
jgi:MOSC domain-containing protein YiiM